MRGKPDAVRLFVLVAGPPGSGKSTLAAALALRLPLIAKDEIKEALMQTLESPETVAESQRLGRAAVMAMLAVARSAPGAWNEHHLRPLDLGPLLEVDTSKPLDISALVTEIENLSPKQ
jgi:hypothetical protein